MTARPAKAQPARPPALKSPTKPPVYVLPTRFGGAFVLVCLLTLIGCINYLLSLGYALTFLLLSVWVVCAVHASRALTVLELDDHALGVTLPERVFAGAGAGVDVSLRLPARPPGAAVGVRLGQQLTWLETQDQPAGGRLRAVLPLPPLERGPQPLPTLRLEALDALGLWRARVYPEDTVLPVRVLVCPAPEHAAPAAPRAAEAGQPSPLRRSSGDEELHGLREYRPGDAVRHIAWKQVARRDQLLSRVYDAPVAAELALDWAATAPAGDVEARLRRLCAWVLDAERQDATFSLSLPGARLERGGGDAQVRRALELLARFERPEGPLPVRRWWRP